MSVADKLGFGPSREVRDHPAKPGFKIVAVKAPVMFNPEGYVAMVTLSPEQFNRYELWRKGSVMIQDALYDLSSSDREKLMSGLS